MSVRYSKQLNELNRQQQGEALEIIDALDRGYKDPVFFCEYFLGIPLHAGQERWLRNSDPVANPASTLKNILAPCNRWGKTMVESAKHIRFNFYKIGADRKSDLRALKELRYATLDLSPHSNQVQALYNYIFDILHDRFVIQLPDGTRTTNKCKIKSFFVSKNDSKNRIQFSNHSEFFGASTGEDSGASLAGRQFGLITYDECVFSHHLRMELPARIMSRTIDFNAPIDLVSTFDAEAKSQQYYFGLVRKGMKGQNEWYTQVGTFSDNKFIPEATIKSAADKIRGEDFNKYRQVFLGEAVAASGKVFAPEVVENIFRPGIEPREPGYGRKYLISVDWGGSDQGDPTVMLVLDCTMHPFYIVHHEAMQGGSPSIQFSILKHLQERYNNAKIIMDTAALGGVVIKKLLSEMGVVTMDFNASGKKADAVFQLSYALSFMRKPIVTAEGVREGNPDFGLIRSYYIPDLEEQLGAYEVDDTKLTQDWVSALYQACWYLLKKNIDDSSKTYLLARSRKLSTI